MHQPIRLIATCPEEGQNVLVSELQALGATAITPLYKAVQFEVDEDLFYRCHLELATASTIMRLYQTGYCPSEDALFKLASRVSWSDIFSEKRTFRVDGVCGDRGPSAMNKNTISMAIRKAIESNFRKTNMDIPKVDVKDPDVVVVGFIREKSLNLSIVTSGKSLHKRGYRSESHHPAPLKETLAATCLKLAGYTGTTPLLDPMCGTGTIVIEAAMMALNKPCNIHRSQKDFGFSFLKDFDNTRFRKVSDEARLKRKSALEQPIYASDINAEYVAEAQKNALRARVERDIVFSDEDFFAKAKPVESGLLITNLPYGTRIEIGKAHENAEDFYARLGTYLKHNFTGWRAAILVDESSPWQKIGLKPTAKIPLQNGSIKTRLLIFDLFSGTRKDHRKEGLNQDRHGKSTKNTAS